MLLAAAMLPALLAPFAQAKEGYYYGHIEAVSTRTNGLVAVRVTPPPPDQDFTCRNGTLQFMVTNLQDETRYRNLAEALSTNAEVAINLEDKTSSSGNSYCEVTTVERRTPTGGTPTTDPNTDDPNADPIDDIALAIPEQCAREVSICIRDYACEDGDLARVTVNGRNVFGSQIELFNAWECRTVPVNAGNNRLAFYALNGSGYKCGRNCASTCIPGDPSYHPDLNTGELRITGRGGDRSAQRWEHSGGRGSVANLSITVGPRTGGSCDAGIPPQGFSEGRPAGLIPGTVN